MTTPEIEILAQAMYEACTPVKPQWAQLGDATRSVWRERAQAKLSGREMAASGTHPAAAPAQAGLF